MSPERDRILDAASDYVQHRVEAISRGWKFLVALAVASIAVAMAVQAISLNDQLGKAQDKLSENNAQVTCRATINAEIQYAQTDFFLTESSLRLLETKLVIELLKPIEQRDRDTIQDFENQYRGLTNELETKRNQISVFRLKQLNVVDTCKDAK